MIHIIVLPLLLLSYFDLTVSWQDHEKGLLNIRYEEDMTLAKECIDTGFVYEQRFLLQACDDDTAWFPDCRRTRKQVHKLSRDPVRSMYVVVTDLHGDIDGPVSNSFPTLQEAFDSFSQVDDFPISHLQRDDKEKNDLSVRIVTVCKGEYSETLAQLSYLLTLGLLDIGGSDSGWIDFDLNEKR